MKDLEAYIGEAIKNIRSDRAITTALLQKKAGSEQGLTDEDKSELFDLIKETGNG